MKSFKVYIISILFFGFSYTLYAQEDQVDVEDIEFIIERSQPLTIDLEEEEEEEDPRKKKKKPKKNVFYGIKS